MNFAAALPTDFFDEKGFQKEYRPTPMQQQIGSMNVLRKVQDPSNGIYISETGEEIHYNTSTSVSDPVPAAVPTPDFPFIEFLLMEVVTQSHIDFPSISDTLDLRKNNNSSSKATRDTDLPLKSVQNCSSHEEMREIRDLTMSVKHTQSTRDSHTISISDNSTPRKSIPGTKADSPTALQVETDISLVANREIPEFVQNEQLSNNRSVTPFSSFNSKVLQVSIPDPIQSTSDDFQVKNSNSLQRKGEDDVFQLIQKIHNQLQQVQWDLQRLHSLHKYEN